MSKPLAPTYFALHVSPSSLRFELLPPVTRPRGQQSGLAKDGGRKMSKPFVPTFFAPMFRPHVFGPSSSDRHTTPRTENRFGKR